MGYMSRLPNSNEPERKQDTEKMVACQGPCKRKVPWHELNFDRLCSKCRPDKTNYGANSDGDWDAE